MKTRRVKEQKGITLIALVITIIVLLILAGVAISMLSGENGILNKSTVAKNRWEESSKSEEETLENLERMTDISMSSLLNDDLNQELKTFIIVWRVNDGETISLPLIEKTTNANSYTAIETNEEDLKYDFKVDYGDGNIQQVKSYDDVNATHTYEKAGDYEIKITGLCEGFSFYGKYKGAEHRSNIIALKQWGAIGAVEISFDRCRELLGDIPIPCRNSFVNIKNLPCLFRSCKKITGKIPKDFFLNIPKVEALYGTFSGCNGLTGDIPMIKNMKNLRVAQSLFWGCENLNGKIPDNFLHGCDKLESVYGMFCGCSSLTGTIPENLFANCLNVSDFSLCFCDCSGIQGTIPENLFADCLNASNFTACFNGCSGISGTIPENLFANCLNASDFTACFASCSGLTGTIPEKLFEKSVKVTTFEYTFEFCTGLTGEIPEKLFSSCTEVTNFGSTFSGCIGLTKIPVNLFENNTKATIFKSTFANIDQDGESTDSNINGNTVMNFEGVAPELWNLSGVEGTSCFKGCTKLENYDSIPTEWK